MPFTLIETHPVKECYQYHEAKENQYRRWGNLKPAYYHQKSKEHFKDAEAKLMENLKNSMEELHELLNKRREDKENRHPLDMRPDYYYHRSDGDDISGDL